MDAWDKPTPKPIIEEKKWSGAIGSLPGTDAVCKITREEITIPPGVLPGQYTLFVGVRPKGYPMTNFRTGVITVPLTIFELTPERGGGKFDGKKPITLTLTDGTEMKKLYQRRKRFLYKQK